MIRKLSASVVNRKNYIPRITGSLRAPIVCAVTDFSGNISLWDLIYNSNLLSSTSLWPEWNPRRESHSYSPGSFPICDGTMSWRSPWSLCNEDEEVGIDRLVKFCLWFWLKLGMDDEELVKLAQAGLTISRDGNELCRYWCCWWCWCRLKLDREGIRNDEVAGDGVKPPQAADSCENPKLPRCVAEVRCVCWPS